MACAGPEIWEGPTEGTTAGAVVVGATGTMTEELVGTGTPTTGVETGTPTDDAEMGTAIADETDVGWTGAMMGGVLEGVVEGVTMTTGVVDVEEVVAGAGLTATPETKCGGVQRGGAPGGRMGGVCEKCGAVHAGVAYGSKMTVTVTVVVSISVTCWRLPSLLGMARAPTAKAEARRAEECIVKAIEKLGSDGVVS